MTIKLVDQFANTVTNFSGDRDLTFSGLNTAPDGSMPTVTSKTGSAVNLGTGTTIAFTNGVSSAGGMLVPYKAEGPVILTTTDGTLSTSSTGGAGVSLTVFPAAASKLVIQQEPSATATAGVAFSQQSIIRIEDQFGNLLTGDNTTIVTAARQLGTGTLQGTTTATASGGIVSFVNLSYNAAETIKVRFTSGASTPATSQDIVVSPAVADRLGFTTQPGSATAGAVFGIQPVVNTQDQFGNNSTLGLPANLNVSLTLTAGSGPLQGNLTLNIGTAAGNGIVTFTDLRIDAAGTGKQLTGAASGLSSGISAFFTVSPAAASQLVIQQQPSPTATAGAAFLPQPVIRIVDSFGNVVTTDSSTLVTASRNAGIGILQGTLTATALNGVVSFANLSHNLATTITIDFTSGSLTSVTSANVAISPALASKLVIQKQPSATATAGAAFADQPEIRIEDSFGNLIANDNTTIVTASRNAGSGILQGTLTATAINGIASFANLSHKVATTITIDFTSGTLTKATSNPVLVSPTAADHVAFATQPGSAVAGAVFGNQPVLKSRDSFENDSTIGLPPNLNVDLTLTTGTGPLQGNTTLDIGTAAGNGTVTFLDLRIDAAGTGKILTVAAGTLGNQPSASFDVLAAAPSQLAFVQQPTSASAGAVITPAVTVRVQDGFGNEVSGAVVTLTLNGNGTLSGTTARTTGANGLAVFNDLSIEFAGSKTLLARVGPLGPVESSAFTIFAGPASKLAFLTAPQTLVAGTLSDLLVVQLQDSSGNFANAGPGGLVVNLSTTSPGGFFRDVGDTTTISSVTIPAGASTVDFKYRDTVAGAPTVRAAATGLNAANQIETITPNTPIALEVAGYPSPVAADTLQSFIVTAKDQFGNSATGYVGTIQFSSSDLQAVLPPDYMFVGTDAGVHTFSATLKTVGLQSITASDTVDPSMTDTQSDIQINPAGAVTFLVTGYTSPTTAGDFHNFMVTAMDAFGNVATGYLGTIQFTSSDLQAALPGAYTFTSTDAGIRTFSAALKTAGIHSITGKDTVSSSITG
ncbi:MAG: hypothetical protein DME26_19955, partial [Verrucomicrobia bacterium]